MFKSEPQCWTGASARRTARSSGLARLAVPHQQPPEPEPHAAKLQRHGGSVPEQHSTFRSVFSRPSPLTPTTPTPRITRIQEEMRFKVLRALEQQPDLSQRQLAD